MRGCEHLTWFPVSNNLKSSLLVGIILKYCIPCRPESWVLSVCREEPEGWNSNVFNESSGDEDELHDPEAGAGVDIVEGDEDGHGERVEEKYENVGI